MLDGVVGFGTDSGDRSFLGSLLRTGMDGSSSMFFGAREALKTGDDTGLSPSLVLPDGVRILTGFSSFTGISTLSKSGMGRALKLEEG